MSVASSAASNISVTLGGQEMSLEQALDQATREIQEGLNSLQLQLRGLAMLEEQQVDDDDFKQAVECEDLVNDLVDGLKDLLDELSDITREIVGKAPNADLKAWWAEHKKARKEAAAAAKEAAKEAARLAKITE